MSEAIEVFTSAAAAKYLPSSIAANRSIRVGAEGNTMVAWRVAAIACPPRNVRQAQVIPATNDWRYDAINVSNRSHPGKVPVILSAAKDLLDCTWTRGPSLRSG
jgi:hypothetical protein